MSEDTKQSIVILLGALTIAVCLTIDSAIDQKYETARYKACVAHHAPAECKP